MITECEGRLASDRPAWRRLQGDKVREIRKILLKSSQVYDRRVMTGRRGQRGRYILNRSRVSDDATRR